MAALSFCILLAMVLGVAYFRAPKLLSALLVGLTLLLLTLWGQLNFFFVLFCWLIYVFIIAFIFIKPLRQRYLIQPLIKKLSKQMPPISNTEREAIEAGDVWWEKDLFSGRPRWKKLLAFPKPMLTADEQSFLNNQVETLCSMVNDWEIVNNAHDLPTEVWDYLKKERFFGMVIPKEYGGLGFSALAHSTIVVKLASRSISVAVNTMVPNSLGPGELLTHYGTPSQKKYYLPRLARGEEIPCFALTGPLAGSDAASLTDFGIVCYGEHEGQNVLGVRLTWDKRYITLAPVATVLGIAFRLYDPDHLLGDTEDIGITLCLVPTSHPGVEIGNRHLPLYLAFMNGPTRGENVFIPLDWIIGGIEMAGHGWRMLMECLSIGRSISLPALSTACGKMAYRLTGGYARVRKQFNVPIAQFEGIEEALGNIAGLTYILEANRLMTAGAVDLKLSPAIASAIAKYHMTEMSRTVIAHAMDIHAGHGIQVGPRNLLSNAHISIPISITVEGANILTRNLIIFGQGAIRCHPYVLKEVNLLSEPPTRDRTAQLDRLLISHIGYVISNVVRSFWQGLTGGYLIMTPKNGNTGRLYRQLTRMSSALALLADMTMLFLGGNLKRKERISARLGDMLSYLYLASAVLKYFNDERQPDSDLDYVRWSVEHCLHQIQIACDELLDNYPKRWIGKVLHFIIFPWGYNAYPKPRDILHHRMIKDMVEPSPLRDRLTSYCYLSQEASDPLHRIDKALSKIQALDPLWKKFQNAIRSGTVPSFGSLRERLTAAVNAAILTEDEMQLLYEFDSLYQDVIRVNEFSFDLRTIVI